MRGAFFGGKGIAALAVASCISFFTDNSSSIPSGTLQECGPRRGRAVKLAVVVRVTNPGPDPTVGAERRLSGAKQAAEKV